MQENKCLLPLFYWGPIQYYSKFYKYETAIIEQWETYPKQTFRNRCELYGPNGLQSIQVPVERGSFHKTLYKDLKIDYSTAWQKNHLKTIESAYRSTPFFEFFIDDVEQFYKNKYKFLIDYNLDILNVSLEWLSINKELKLSADFEKNPNIADYREIILPKSKKQVIDSEFEQQPYIQGFEQRHGFIPNLSILDLVFNTGPEASSIIKGSIL